MGGSTAALVAMLLRNDTRLIMRMSSAVRAVCLGPATVLDLHTAMACRDFVASVVYGEHGPCISCVRTPTITKDLDLPGRMMNTPDLPPISQAMTLCRESGSTLSPTLCTRWRKPAPSSR